MAFCALIPAAGRSQRMGRAKAWLPIAGEPALARIVGAATAAGAAAVVVVAGCIDETPGLASRIEIAVRIQTPPHVRLSVAIGEPDGHAIDSIRAGYALVPEGLDILLWPVDAPFADAGVVRDLASALGSRRDQIAIPVVAGRRAHPVLLGAAVGAELTTPVADAGARGVVHRDDDRVIEVAATDARIAAPLNTPEEAARLGVVAEPLTGG